MFFKDNFDRIAKFPTSDEIEEKMNVEVMAILNGDSV